jgi:hypothetical protein
MRTKHLLKLALADAVGQIADIKLLTQGNSPEKE